MMRSSLDKIHIFTITARLPPFGILRINATLVVVRLTLLEGFGNPERESWKFLPNTMDYSINFILSRVYSLIPYPVCLYGLIACSNY